MNEQFLVSAGAITMIVFVMNVLMASAVIFYERRNPASTWAWLLVLFFIPIFGFFAYLVFGKNGKKEKVFQEKGKHDQEFYFKYLMQGHHNIIKIQKQMESIEKQERILDEKYLTDLAYLHLNSGNWVTFNNEVEVFDIGDTKFGALIEDIKNAKEHIHMQYYIWRGDGLGKRLVEELAKKAKEGVEVRVLYDGMGNARLPKNFFKPLQDAGGYASAFLPPFIVRLNYRNHRKLAVIDGEIGYIGGFNVGDEYLGIVKRYGNWRDTHLKFKGDAIDQMQIRFIMDWNFTTKYPESQVVLGERYFPTREQFDGVKTQIVSSGPDTQWKNIRNGYFKMMNEAEKSIYLVTPYFVPDDAIFESLKIAALSGIDVRIMIPANPDHFFVYWASMSYLDGLLKAGVRCYQYEKGFVHAKVLCVDGTISSVGTANMDIRSFAVNFEVNAFLFDKETTRIIEEQFLKDLEDCKEITVEWYEARSAGFKFKESVSRLISPML